MDEVSFVDTTLRDGSLSLWAMRMRTGMMIPVVEALDRAGFQAIEVFSTTVPKIAIHELKEDPWERLDLIRQRVHRTPLRLITTRNLRGFQFTPPAIMELWYERIAAHGISEARISDPSNTEDGWRAHLGYARRVGIVPILNLIYAIAPKYSDEYYAEKARAAAALEPLRICLKDPGGLLTPERLRTLLPAIKRNARGIPLELHTHCNTGLGSQCCVEAVRQGVRSIDTAIPPLAERSSNPSLFNVAMNVRALGYTTTVDVASLKPVEDHFTSIARREGLAIGTPSPYDISSHVHQVPGGMVSNLRSQLTAIKLESKLPDIVEEIGRVRVELGCPIMVTPYAQFVGVQATMNVMTGERYRETSDEVIQFALGQWGNEEASSMDPNIRDRILDRPRAKELARWTTPDPSLKEVRKSYGGPGVSDDEMLLRYLAGAQQVAAMRAAGPFKTYDGGRQGLVGLMEELKLRNSINYIHLQKDTTSLMLRNH